MTRRQQDARKVQFCLLKLGVSVLPLAPAIIGDYVNIVDAPLETTRYLAGLLLVMDLITFRFLFLEDLVARKGQAAIWKGPPWSFPNAGLYILGSVVGFFVGIILFGAPMFDSWLETLHLAMLLTVVTATPFCLVYAQPVDEFLKLIQTIETEMNMDKACFVPGLMAIVGAWCGSVVIPLDWDRPWQKWPIPSCCGAFAGYAMGNCGWLMALLWKSWRKSVFRSSSKTDRFLD